VTIQHRLTNEGPSEQETEGRKIEHSSTAQSLGLSAPVCGCSLNGGGIALERMSFEIAGDLTDAGDDAELSTLGHLESAHGSAW